MKKLFPFFLSLALTSTLIFSVVAKETTLVSLSPQEIVTNMDNVFSRVNDYTCIADAHYKKGALKEDKVYKIYFKRPGLMRIEVLEGDPGAVAVLREDGKVRGHKGGWLSWIKLTVDLDHPLATTIRGHRMNQSHFGYMIGVMKKILVSEEARVIGEGEVEGQNVYVMEVVHEKPRGDLTRELIYVDKETWLLKKILGYEGRREVVNVTYRDIVLNPGLKDELFRM